MKKLLTSLAIGAVTCSVSSATVLLSESFNYPVNPPTFVDGSSLAGANDGIVAATGLAPSGTWTTTYQTGSGLTFNATGLSTSLISGTGGATNVTNTTASGGTGSMRTWGSSVGTADGTVYWGRILIDFNNLLPGEVTASTSPTIGNTQGDALRLFSNGGTSGIGFEMFQTPVETVPTAHIRTTIGNGSARVNGTSVSFNHLETQLLVFKITFDVDETADERLDFWLNPASLSTEGGLGVPTSSVVTAASLPVGAVVFRRDNGTTTPWVADEFVLGTTFADISVVPEPSSFAALAGLGALGFATSRRRRA